MSSSGWSALDELAARPDAPVLIIHAPEGEDATPHVSAAKTAYAAMVVIRLQGNTARAEAMAGRDVVLWPWEGKVEHSAALVPFADELSRHALRLRLISPRTAADELGPASLNGHDPIAWAQANAYTLTPQITPNPETHDLVSDWDSPPVNIEIDPPEPRQRFGFKSAEAMIAEPTPTDWLLQGWFERNTLAMYFGDPSSCKTWLAVSQAVHIALGVPWFGARVQQGAVFVLCGEGHRGFRRRLEGIRKHHDMDFTGVPLYVSDGPANLTERESVDDVLVAVQALVETTGYAPVLVVIDTISRNFGAADENATSDMAAFINACDRVRTTYGCTVLLVHHSGHGDKNRGRGNSALRAALDTEFKFVRSEVGTIETTCTKAKDFEAPDMRAYRLENVHLDWPVGEDGLPVNSAAPIPCGDVPRGTEEAKPSGYLGKNQTDALATLRELVAVHRSRMSASGRNPDTARVSLAEWREASTLDRRRMHEAQTALEARDLIRSDGIYVFLND